MLQFSVVRKLRNRLHVKVSGHRFTEAEAAYVEDTLLLNDAIVDVTFYTRSSQIAIKHNGDSDAVRDAVLGLRDLDLSEAPALNEYSPRLVNKKYREMMINRTAVYLGKKAVLPAPIAAAWAWFDGIKFIGKAIKTLWQRKLTVEVLDGVAIGAALLQKDYPTASAVMYLLGIGDILEEWTHRKSVLNLAQSMSLNVDKVWVLVDDIEVSKPVNEVVAGDQIIIRQGEVIPLDGTVIDGVVLVMKALSFVMVDFSCALKLSIPLAVLSAMQEASKRGITVKGGKFLEQIARADMIVFDKTGTLTKAEPEFEQIIPFNGHDADEMLKLAACIEEHFPHSMAKAIVRAAKDHALPHKEMHSDVEYVVAHGIASKVGRYRVRIGSAHYIFDDEKTKIPADEQEKFNNLPNTSSHIYLAIGGTLAAVICIKDPVREEAKQVIADLHALGIKKVVMMTGDSKRNAQRVADELGIDEVHAEVLPEDKASYVKQAKADGYTVMMVGDGINDSPAISEAHVGIAMNEGAPIAQKIANVTISSDHLQALVDLRRISIALMKRIKANYNGIVGFNGALVGGGVLGIMPPSQTAWLHNLFTLGIGLESMTPLLKKEEQKETVPTIDVTADSVVA